VLSEAKVIEVNDCKSDQPVNMTYCFGQCGSSSKYSASANSMLQKCECCQVTSTTQRQVALKCSDGSRVDHTYTLATGCACSPSQCPTQTRRRRRR
uniref:CTCK domain-containing protein n=2 Tax=Periophthalmus magnuspinnatus TaxID=409849 RepID=A0A3B4AGM8_9GOBI